MKLLIEDAVVVEDANARVAQGVKQKRDTELVWRAKAFDDLLAAVREGQRYIEDCVDHFDPDDVTPDATAALDECRAANKRLLDVITKYG